MSDPNESKGNPEDSGIIEQSGSRNAESQSITRERLQSLPDLPEIIGHPVYQKLETITEIFFRENKRDIISKETADEILIKGAQADIAHVNHLAELLFRVRKGVIPLQVLVNNFPESTVKKHILDRLHNYVVVYDIEQKADDLDFKLKRIVETRLLSVQELLAGAQNQELFDFIRDRLSASGMHYRPKFRAYYTDVPKFPADSGPPPDGLNAESVMPPGPPSITPSGFPGSDNRFLDESVMRRLAESAAHPPRISQHGTEPDDEDQRVTIPSGLHRAVPPPKRPPTGIAYAATLPGIPAVRRSNIQSTPEITLVLDELPEPAHEAAESAETIRMPVILQIDSGTPEIRPLPFAGEAHTIGSDSANDIVISGDYTDAEGNPIVKPFHAEVKVVNGKIFVRARPHEDQLNLTGGPVKIDGEKQIVLTRWREVEDLDNGTVIMDRRDRPFYLLGKIEHKNDTDRLPCFLIDPDAEIEKGYVKNCLKWRFDDLVKEHAGAIMQLLAENNADAKKTAGQRANMLREKFIKILEAVSPDGVPLFSDSELIKILAQAHAPVSGLLRERLEAALETIGSVLENHVRTNFETIAHPLVKADILALDEGLKAMNEFNTVASFADRHLVPLVEREMREKMIEDILQFVNELRTDLRVLAEQQKAAEEAVLAQKKAAEEAAIAAKIEADRIRLTGHEAAITQAEAKFGRGRVHFLEDREMLAENHEFLVRPAARIIGPGKSFLKALISDVDTIGYDGSNTIEVKKYAAGEKSTKPFMASLERQPDGTYMVVWIAGRLRWTTGERHLGPRFPIAFDRPLDIGPYSITIEDHHAYTAAALKLEEEREINERIEVIFDQDHTTQEQNNEACLTIRKILEGGRVNEKECKGIIIREMIMLWESIGAWSNNRPLHALPGPEISENDDEATRNAKEAEAKKRKKTILQDAQFLHTLHSLLEDRGVNLPLTPFTQGNVMREARRRLETYAELDRDARAEISLLGQAALSIRPGKARKLAGQREEQRAKAAAGAIQIARLLEMQLLKDGDLPACVAMTPEYLEEIMKVKAFREMVHAFRKGGEGVKLLPQIMRESYGKTMGCFFSDDEINIANLNCEVKLNADSPVEKYLRALAVFVGRKSFHVALKKADCRAEVAAVRELLKHGLIQYGQLGVFEYDNEGGISPLIDPVEVKAQFEELAFNADELEKDLRAQEEAGLQARIHKAELGAAKREALKHTADLKQREKLRLVEKAKEVGNAINAALEGKSLRPLLAVAGYMNDPGIAAEMGDESVMLESLEFHDLPQPARKTVAKTRFRASRVSAERKNHTWDDAGKMYKRLALWLGLEAAAKVTDGLDATYNLLLVKKALRENLFTLSDLGVDMAQLEAGVKKERELREKEKLEQSKIEARNKHKDFYEQAMNGRFSDVSALEKISPDAVTDETEKEVLREMFNDICYRKLSVILDHLRKGVDVAFMKLLAKKILKKGYEADKFFSAGDLALLQ